jgi:adenylate cyclase
MATEIERKFLVDKDMFFKAHPQRQSIPMEQGYLSVDPAVRVRSSGGQARLTIKGPGLVERAEYEYAIPMLDFVGLFKLCKYQIRKIRHMVTVGEDQWEVDEFSGSLHGLMIAEIELKHVTQRFDYPTWLRDEVTEDPRYQNSRLAVDGVPV